jgi:hypothetical protein
MPELCSFDYATLRIVPNAERAEFINAGVVMHCPEQTFLGCRILLDEARLRALWPTVDVGLVRDHLEAFPRIATGSEDSGPIARLSRSERFHWLVAPRSTMIQVSPVHSGICASPEHTIDELFRRLVAVE